MRKVVMILSALAFLIISTTGLSFADKDSAPSFKAGDTIYVCQCGKACKCGTMSYKEGTCGCGKKLIKTTVTRTENGQIFYNVNGSEYSAPAAGKYVCPCGSGCGCGTVSQKPGKCACGKPMKKIE